MVKQENKVLSYGVLGTLTTPSGRAGGERGLLGSLGT